mgnify:CR=1 FL=1
MAPLLGLLTIGQSPRPDGLAADIETALAGRMCVVERGALDGLSKDEIDQMRPRPGDYHLVTVLRDGTPVQLAKAAILSRLQEQITELEQREGVAATLLLCTGAFPSFTHQQPLLQPQAALYGAVIGMAGTGTIGALTPLPEQIEQARAKWRAMGVADVRLAAADPYGADPLRSVRAAAAEVRAAGATILFLDCFGYDLTMRAVAREEFRGPVILARTLAAHLAAEMVA